MSNHNLDVGNAILIVDEGHNLGSACENAGSCEISTVQVQAAISALKDGIDVIQDPKFKSDGIIAIKVAFTACASTA